MRRTKRGIAATLLIGVAALGASVALGSPSHAAGSPPSGASLPDFSNGNTLYTEQIPKTWGFWAYTGGLKGGETVTLSFKSGNQAGDGLHSVAFTDVLAEHLKNDVEIANVNSPAGTAAPTSSGLLPSLPASLPASPPANPGAAPGVPGCTVPVSLESQAVVSADPFNQSISIQVLKDYSAGSLLGICFTSNFVAFPVTPGSYSMEYTEPGGSTSVGYTVTAQTPGKSNELHVHDVDGSDATDIGSGASHRLLSYDTTYPVTIAGLSGSRYSILAQAYIAEPLSAGPASLKVTLTGNSAVGCTGDIGDFCADPQTGTATGTLVMHNLGPADVQAPVAYVSIQARQQATAGATTESVPSGTSVTVGPSGQSAPSSTPPPTLPPTTGGPAFNLYCPQPQPPPGYPDHGLGGLDFNEAHTDVLLPSFQEACPEYGQDITFTVSDESLAVSNVRGYAYAFAGLDRPLSAQEWSGNASASNVFSPLQSGNIEQFPLYLQPLVVTYNLPTDSRQCQQPSDIPLQLSSLDLSNIFTGAVTQWNDPSLLADNQWLRNCRLPILVAHDTGRASSVLKDYLSKRNGQWSGYAAASVDWPPTAPVACTANGSDAMALCVSAQPGTIGYGTYHAIVTKAGLPVAAVDNSAHQFFDPLPQPSAVLDGCTVTAGTDPAVPQTTLQDWSTVSLTDWAAPGSYPICTFDFVAALRSPCKPQVYDDRTMRAYVNSAVDSFTQRRLRDDGYAELPDASTGTVNNLVSVDQTGLSGMATC